MTFDEMRKLGPNWDSYGALPIDPKCIQKAIDLIYVLPGKWEPIPCSDGSVQLEQHVGGFDLELMISRAEKETVPAPEASIVEAFARSPRRIPTPTCAVCGEPGCPDHM